MNFIMYSSSTVIYLLTELSCCCFSSLLLFLKASLKEILRTQLPVPSTLRGADGIGMMLPLLSPQILHLIHIPQHVTGEEISERFLVCHTLPHFERMAKLLRGDHTGKCWSLDWKKNPSSQKSFRSLPYQVTAIKHGKTTLEKLYSFRGHFKALVYSGLSVYQTL